MGQNIFDLDGKAILLYCKKHRLLLLISFLFITGYSIKYYLSEPPLSEAKIEFFGIGSELANTKNIFDESSEGQIYSAEADISRIMFIGHSTEIVEFLINRFNLYQRYGIDSSKEESYESIYKQTENSFGLVNYGYGTFTLTVKNKDKYLAVEMANAIVQKIDEINKKIILQSRKRSLEVYEKYYTHLNNKISEITNNYIPEKTKNEILKTQVNTQGLQFWDEHKQTKYTLEYNKSKLGYLEKSKKSNDSILTYLKAEVVGLESKFALLSSDSANYMNKINSMINLDYTTSQISQSSTFFYTELNITEKLRQRTIEALNIESQLSSLIVMKKAYPQEAKIDLIRIAYSIMIVIIAVSFLLIMLILWENSKENLKLLFSK